MSSPPVLPSPAAVRRPASGQRFVILIPVHNHPARLAEVLHGALRLGLPVLVVDDGSTDDTPAVLDGFPQIRRLRHPTNRGKGAALLTGFAAAAADADWAITLDADGQHDPADIDKLMDAIPAGERPLVVGCRAGMEGPNTPWTSRFGRGFSNFWIRCAGGHRSSDSQSGFRIYPLPEVLQLGCRARRFQFEVEVLVKARWKGVPLREATVSVRYEPRGQRVSHFRPWTDFWRNASTFTRLIAQRILQPAPWRRRRLPLLAPPRAGAPDA